MGAMAKYSVNRDLNTVRQREKGRGCSEIACHPCPCGGQVTFEASKPYGKDKERHGTDRNTDILTSEAQWLPLPVGKASKRAG